MFALMASRRKDFYNPVPHEWEYFLNRCLEVQTPGMFLYFADHLHMSGLRIRERLGRFAEVEIEETTLGEFSRTTRHVEIRQLAPNDMIRVRGEGGVSIGAVHETIPKWIEMSIFRGLRRQIVSRICIFGRSLDRRMLAGTLLVSSDSRLSTNSESSLSYLPSLQ